MRSTRTSRGGIVPRHSKPPVAGATAAASPLPRSTTVRPSRGTRSVTVVVAGVAAWLKTKARCSRPDCSSRTSTGSPVDGHRPAHAGPVEKPVEEPAPRLLRLADVARAHVRAEHQRLALAERRGDGGRGAAREAGHDTRARGDGLERLLVPAARQHLAGLQPRQPLLGPQRRLALLHRLHVRLARADHLGQAEAGDRLRGATRARRSSPRAPRPRARRPRARTRAARRRPPPASSTGTAAPRACRPRDRPPSGGRRARSRAARSSGRARGRRRAASRARCRPPRPAARRRRSRAAGRRRSGRAGCRRPPPRSAAGGPPGRAPSARPTSRAIPPGHARALGERPVEPDQPEAARLVAGAHRVVRVGADRLRPARERAPRPDPQVLRGHGRADVERDRAEAALQLADPEAAPRRSRSRTSARSRAERPATRRRGPRRPSASGRRTSRSSRPAPPSSSRPTAPPSSAARRRARRPRRGSSPRDRGRRASPPRTARAGPPRACRR